MRLAADANVLLSAVVDDRAKSVLEHPGVAEVLTTAFTVAEVEEYAAELARKKGLPLGLVLMRVADLPVTVVHESVWSGSVAEAERRIGSRDSDDVPLLALALHFGIPVWSNDNDFAGVGAKRYTTAQLLAKLDR